MPTSVDGRHNATDHVVMLAGVGPVEILLIWILLMAACTVVAWRRDRSPLWALVAIPAPLIALILMLVLPARRSRQAPPATV